MAVQCMLTTIDNPYDPFEQFDEWYQYDNDKGYNTCGYLDRMADLPNDLSDEEAKIATERAIDTIILNDFMHLYKKVTMTTQETWYTKQTG